MNTTAITPPHDDAAEDALLGSMLLDPGCIDAVYKIVNSPDAFYSGSNRTIFSAILELHRENNAVDSVTLLSRLARKSHNEIANLTEHLRGLLHSVPSAANAEYYAKIVRDKYLLRRQISRLDAGIKAAYENDHNRAASEAQAAVELAKTTGSGHRLAVLSCMAEVEETTVRWAWPGVFPLGMLSLIAGDPGLGKSTAALDFAARITTGRDMPDKTPGILGDVILLSAEDPKSSVIKRRLRELRADDKRVFILNGQCVVTESGERIVDLTLQDVRAIEDAILQRPECRLLIVDPISAYMGSADSHVNSDVRSILKALAELAEKHNIAVILISHLNKAGGVRAVYRITGSLAFIAACRTAWLVSQESEASDERLFTCIKSNVGPSNRGWKFRRLIDGRLEWDSSGIEITAQQALDELDRKRTDDEPQRGPLPEKREACVTWLSNRLAAGPVLTATVMADAVTAGYPSEHTLRDAKNALGVVSYKPTNPGPNWWKLPISEALAPEQKTLLPLENNGKCTSATKIDVLAPAERALDGVSDTGECTPKERPPTDQNRTSWEGIV
jgi:putative DNA primase/helicase